ncbi:MAG: hypothetical protein SX243_23235 [Acidobacteriota bacterium]|nr:hypothetical protein [Acidobacteriota bacterium]
MPSFQDIASSDAPLALVDGCPAVIEGALRRLFVVSSGGLAEERLQVLGARELGAADESTESVGKAVENSPMGGQRSRDTGLETALPKNLCKISQVLIFQVFEEFYG